MNLRPGGLVTFGTYLVLFLLGAVQGVAGSFQYSRQSPAVAIVLIVLIGATCLLAAWGLKTPAAAFAAALGWIIAAFVLSLPQSNGSVIIANTTAGKWFLYGGTVTVAVTVVAAIGYWVTRQPRRRLQRRLTASPYRVVLTASRPPTRSWPAPSRVRPR